MLVNANPCNLDASKIALLIEDEQVARKIHTIYLEKLGFKVDIAVDGKQALELYMKNYLVYKLIVLDGSLPYMSGVELAVKIRRHEKENNLIRKPLILISAHPVEQINIDCNIAGIDNFAIKPVKFEEFKYMIKKFLPLF